ncbi:MAG TPA: response regulator [Deltaproteobacteria bacterium]|nr:response regulator [Deltaproteobacteria bacterium]
MKKRILTLDDQESMRNVFLFTLKKEFDVVVTSTAEETIEKAKTEPFDFILIDILLDTDRMDGIDVAMELERAGVNTPYGFLTSLSEESLEASQRERAKRLKNLKFYQTKPIPPAELINKIKSVTG